MESPQGSGRSSISGPAVVVTSVGGRWWWSESSRSGCSSLRSCGSACSNGGSRNSGGSGNSGGGSVVGFDVGRSQVSLNCPFCKVSLLQGILISRKFVSILGGYVIARVELERWWECSSIGCKSTQKFH